MMWHRLPRLTAIFTNEEASSVVEFALVFPVFMVLLMGSFDIAQEAYAQSLLNGGGQAVARQLSTEGRNMATAQSFLVSELSPVLPGVTASNISITSESYSDFGDIGRPERWNDTNANGRCDNGEAYVDENGNGQWDADIGENGIGGANDVVVYTFAVTYVPLFRAPFEAPTAGTRTLKATAVKKNQPFSNQTAYGSATGTCS